MRNDDLTARRTAGRTDDYLEYLFRQRGPFWHLCTPGTNQEILFQKHEDYCFGITSSAVCLDGSVKVYAMAVMSNHLHDILAGQEASCRVYFERRKKVLKHYFNAAGHRPDLRDFDCKLLPINDIDALRAEIVYVNRNGYVACPEHTPFSYPWSTGKYYFNPAAWEGSEAYSALAYQEKRKLTHSRCLDLPDGFRVKDGTMHIPSFVCVREGEGFFRDAHQYFNYLSRKREAYGEVARRLGDEVFLTDNELFDAVCSLCRSRFGQSRPSSLSPNDRITVAVTMKQEYNASNGQIRRILRLDDRIVRELFP